MGFSPTTKQLQAMTTIDRDVAVSAGAGSGKTKVLVERFVHLLEQGFGLDQVAAITFTRKAAQEMRDRVRQQLLEHPTLASLAEQMPQAQISTIHSLCQRILAEHPLQARIDPRFRLGEEWEMDALLQDLAEDVIRQRLESGDRILLEIKEEFRQTTKAAEELVAIYKSMVGVGVRDFQPGQDEKQLEQALDEAGFVLRREWEALIEAYRGGQLESASEQKQELLSGLHGYWQEQNASLTGPPGHHIPEICAKVRSFVKGNWGRLKEVVSPLTEAADQWEQAWVDRIGYERLDCISRTLTDLHEAFEDAKLRQGLLDFNDLEFKALQLLQDASIKESYNFAHLMVDEFQDTNHVQKQIIDGLRTSTTRLFIVGDAKQSIYRFRSADVQVFLDTQREIVQRDGVHISLDDNFRSVPSLVSFANRVFPILMDGDAVTYHPSQAGREDGAPSASVEIVLGEETQGTTKENEENAKRSSPSAAEQREFEAQAIARRIRLGWEQGEFGLHEVAFLFRVTSDIKLYEQALQAEGLPYVNFAGRNFHSTREIRDILEFADWLLDPANAVAEMAVLRSPFFAVSDEGLLWYRLGQWDKASGEDQDRIQEATSLYPHLRRVAFTEPAPRFFRQLFERTQFCGRTASGLYGSQRLANIMKLEETSWELWAKGHVTLQEQCQYIRQLMEGRDLEGEARVLDEDMESITIMTIHGSKGLEFPVVVVPDLNRQLRRSQKPYVSYHKDWGMAIRDTSAAQKVQDANMQEHVAELKRLLYVAVTRAENKLILSGCRNGKEAAAGTWDELITWWEWLWCLRQQTDAPVDEWTIPPVADGLEAIVRQNDLKKTPGSRVESVDHVVHRVTEPPWTAVPRLTPVPARVNHSVTSLLAFERCPRCYYYRYILRVPEQPRGLDPVFRSPLKEDLPEPWEEAVSSEPKDFVQQRMRRDGILLPTQRGSIIHRVCQFIREESELEALLEQSIALEGVPVQERERANLLQMARRYTSSASFQQNDPGQIVREWPFQVEVGHSFVTGAVDQIFVQPDGVVLSDLKTNHIGRRHVPAAVTQYRLQLELYAWAWSVLDPRPINGIQLHFLVPGHVEVLPWSEERRVAIDRWVWDTTIDIADRAEKGPTAFPATGDCGGNYACTKQFEIRME